MAESPLSPLFFPAAALAAVERVGVAGALFDAIFEENPVGLGIFTLDLRCLRVNAAFASLNGVNARDIAGRRLVEALPQHEAIAELLATVARTGEPVVARPVTVTSPEAGATSAAHRLASAYRVSPGQTGDVLVLVSVDVTDQLRAEDLAQAANRRLRLLARASERLGASLDVAATASGLVSLLVPDLADHAMIDLLDLEPTGRVGVRLRRAAMAHRPTAAAPERPYSPPGEIVPYAAGHAAIQALETGRPVLVAEVTSDDLVAGARDPAVGASLATVGIRSQVAVPLLAREGSIGVLLLKQSVSERSFTDDDVAVAAELAARAGVAIDNARRYSREHAIALTLQRELMRAPVTATAEVETAARYLPAAGGTHVGGDWYDVVPLGAGRIALMVGDVMGRGLPAATVMGQVRTAARTLAHLDLPPRRLLAHLDGIVSELDDQLVTCVYACYDPFASTIATANAGHVPPLICLPDENHTVMALTGGPGIPLGVGGVPFTQAEDVLPPGSIVAFYSDGLVELRTRDLDVGIDELRAVLGDAVARHDDLERVADDVVRAMVSEPESHDDDVTLLLVRIPRQAAPRATFDVPAEAAAVPSTRHFVEATLRSWAVGAATIEPAVLLVSELVTNALRHGGAPIVVRLRIAAGHLQLDVEDHGAALPEPRSARSDDEGGRGLQLVAAVAAAWGTRPLEHGKSVWCTLSLDQAS